MNRVGLLGGTFDPPHDGHLRLAELAQEQLSLDALRFVPAARSPHKDSGGSPTGVRERLLRLALAGRNWSVETTELARGGASYTVDTLETLATAEPENAWILLLGFDQATQLPRWHRLPRIWELASIAVARRPGHEGELAPEVLAHLAEAWSGVAGELVLLPSTGLDLSSSALRERLARGESPAGVPPQVLAAIRTENLYR